MLVYGPLYMELPVVDMSLRGLRLLVNIIITAMMVNNMSIKPAMAMPTAKLRCDIQML